MAAGCEAETFIDVPVDRPVIGAIGIENCIFEDCAFEPNLAYMGSAEIMQAMRSAAAASQPAVPSDR